MQEQPNPQNPDFEVPTQPESPIASTNTLLDARAKKPSKWRYFFLVTSLVQIGGAAFFILVIASIAGKTGSEFIALYLLATLVPVVGVVAWINTIGLPIYLFKHKPKGVARIFWLISFVVGLLIALYSAWTAYSVFIAAPRYIAQQHAEIKQKYEAERAQFELDNAKPEITKAQAIQLLNDCQLKGFYYTNQTDDSDKANGGWGELSTTGVVLTKVDGKPYRISIADRHIEELVPIARKAQRKCSDPQFWHDDHYEYLKDGKWYFNGKVVNMVATGNTKKEAEDALRKCKVDYVIGYDSNLDVFSKTTTRDWIESAEKSTTGIKILENSPKTYIFLSKAMTPKIAAVARQYRDNCYDTRVVYVTIGQYVETRDSTGQWVKIGQ